MQGRHESLWIATAAGKRHPPLKGDLQVDACIVGGGILGLTTAYLLQQQGRTVAVLERGRIVEGVTGHTTAKVTSQHGLVYDSLSKRFGKEKTRLHAQANEDAKRRVWDIVRELGVDCNLTKAPAYVYATQETKVQDLKDEARAASGFGLPARFVEPGEVSELPFPVSGALRYDDQSHFHPRKYLLALADRIVQQGGLIHEGTVVTDIHEGEPCRVQTDKGTVSATEVVVATNVPIGDRAFFVTRMKAKREYVLAVEAPMSLEGMYVNCESPRRSVRSYPGETPLLVVGGESHEVGKDSGPEHFEALERFSQESFKHSRVAYRWSTQDYYPVDDLPLIGRYTPTSKHVHVGTGFRAWGMTQSTVAAMHFAELIAKGKSPLTEVYDPYAPMRILKDLVDKDFLTLQATATQGLIGERLKRHTDQPEPGEGRIVDTPKGRAAVYVDAKGQRHALVAKCTHMGCIVGWNAAESSWDCPCHGSRFGIDGKVLQGPAIKPLEPFEE